MNTDNVIEVDALLKLVDAFRLTPNEIVKLNKAGHDPSDEEGYYLTAQQALVWRSTFNAQAAQQLEALAELASMESIELPPPAIETPEVHVPIFGIGL